MSEITIRVLGRFSVERDGRTVISQSWSHTRAAALLKMLAVQAAHELHREVLIDAVWPNLSQPAAATAFRKAIHYLRAALGGYEEGKRAVRTEGGLVCLRNVSVDLHEFRAKAMAARADRTIRAYEVALKGYAGDLLPADIYEDWTEPLRQSLRRQYDELRIELSELYETDGRLTEAIRVARDVGDANPADEALHRRLMHLYGKAGRRDLVTRQYERCKSELLTELDVQPAPETDALHEKLIKRAALPSGLRDRRAARRPTRTARPHAHYLTTDETGTRIAYWQTGTGRSLVCLPDIPRGHVEREWQIPELNVWYSELAKFCTVIGYNARGTGLSTKACADLSLDAHVADLEELVQRISPGRTALFATVHSTPIAISFAARHPDRVSHLLLWAPYVSGAEFAAGSITAMRRLASQDWNLFCESVSSFGFGWSAAEQARHSADLLRASITPEELSAFFRQFDSWDVTAQVGHIECPVLILYRTAIPWYRPELFQRLSRLNGVRIVALPGAAGVPYADDDGAIRAEVASFVHD